jgi:hypothetical protein
MEVTPGGHRPEGQARTVTFRSVHHENVIVVDGTNPALAKRGGRNRWRIFSCRVVSHVLLNGVAGMMAGAQSVVAICVSLPIPADREAEGKF